MSKEYFNLNNQLFCLLFHAQKRMKQRNITQAQLIQILAKGQRTQGELPNTVNYYWKNFKVVVEPAGHYSEVITVMQTNVREYFAL